MSGPSADDVAGTLAALRQLRTGATGDPHASWEDLPSDWADIIQPARTLDAKLSGWLKETAEGGR